MHRAKTSTASQGHGAEATALQAVARDRGGLGVSREELATLERELDAYLAFWAYARGDRVTTSEQDVR